MTVHDITIIHPFRSSLNLTDAVFILVVIRFLIYMGNRRGDVNLGKVHASFG